MKYDFNALMESGAKSLHGGQPATSAAARSIPAPGDRTYNAEFGTTDWFKESAYDYGLAVPRGAVGAAMDLYGLADTLTFDSLPDWNTNPLGESKHGGAAFIEGIANFATGFIPVAGALGKLGKAGKVAKLASSTGKLTTMGNFVAGAVTDFTVFDGNEARLSNLINDLGGDRVPVVSAITNFLAAKEDDPELVGRLKNALEGGTLGEVLGWALSGVLGKTLKAQKVYRAKLAQGVTKEEAAGLAAIEVEGLEGQLKLLETARVEMERRAAKGPEQPKRKAAWDLAPVDNDNDGLLINGKPWDSKDLTLKDWDAWAKSHGFENFGSQISPDTAYKGADGSDVLIPGGIDGERFSLVDMIEIHRRRINPNRLTPDVRVKLYNKMARTNTPDEGDLFDTFNRFAFGILSNGQELEINTMQGALLKVRKLEDIQNLASMIPWKAGDKVDVLVRRDMEKQLNRKFGFQDQAQGGLGFGSRAPTLTALAEFAQNYLKAPEFFRPRKGESQFAFADRVASVSFGMQSKVANFATVWFNPLTSMGGAVDRHMARAHEVLRGIFSTPQEWSDFTAGVIERWNEKAAVQFHNFDIFMEAIKRNEGGEVFGSKVSPEKFLTDAVSLRLRDLDLTTVLNKIAKGEIKDPEYLKFVEEAQQGNLDPFTNYVRTITSQAYFLSLRAIHKQAAEVYGPGVGTFMAQWMNWDLIRGVISPHETMVAGLYKLPKPPLRMVQRRARAISDLGLGGKALDLGNEPAITAKPGDEMEVQEMFIFDQRTEDLLGRREEYDSVTRQTAGRRMPTASFEEIGLLESDEYRASARKKADDLDPQRVLRHIKPGGLHADLASTLVLTEKNREAVLKNGTVAYQIDPMIAMASDKGLNKALDEIAGMGGVESASILDRFGPDVPMNVKMDLLLRAEHLLRDKGVLVIDPDGAAEEALSTVKLVFKDAKVTDDGLIVATRDKTPKATQAYKAVFGEEPVEGDEAVTDSPWFKDITGSTFSDRVDTPDWVVDIMSKPDFKPIKDAQSKGPIGKAGVKHVLTVDLARRHSFAIDKYNRYTDNGTVPLTVDRMVTKLFGEGETVQTLFAAGRLDDIKHAIMSREQIANRYRAARDPKTAAISRWFIDKLADSMLDDVTFRIDLDTDIANRLKSEVTPHGYWEAYRALVVINDNVLAEGNFDRTVLHEMWHSFERYIDPAQHDVILKQFEKERIDFINRTGITPELSQMQSLSPDDFRMAYKYTTVKEWFADTMMEKTVKRFNIESSIENLDGASRWFAKLKLGLMDMVTAWRAAFGADAVDQMFSKVMMGVDLKRQNYVGIVHKTVEYGDLISYSLRGPHYTEFDLTGDKPSFRILRDLGYDAQNAQEILDAVEKRIATFNEADVDLGANPRKLTRAEALAAELQTRDSNLEPWETSDSAKAVFRAYELLADEIYREEVGVSDFATMAKDAAIEAADMVNADPDEFFATVLAKAGQDRENMRRIYSRLIMYKQMTAGYGNKLMKLAQDIQAGQDTSENIAKFVKLEDFYYQLVGVTKALTSESGRSLVSNKVKIHELTLDPRGRRDANIDITNAAGGEDAVRKRIKIITEAGEGGGVPGVTKTVEALRKSYGNMLLEYWMNAILSGPRTMVVNALGGAMMSYYRPLELMMGAGVRGIGGDAEAKAVFDRAFLEMRAISKQFTEASKMAKAAWRTGENVLTSRRGVNDLPGDMRNAITARNMNLKEGTKPAAFVDGLGKFIRIPSNVLTSTDEFWKQVNYRAVVEADLTLRARAQGLDEKQTAEFVTKTMEKIIGDGQAFSVRSLENRAAKKINELERAGQKFTPDQREDFIEKYVKANWNEADNALSKYAMAVGEEVSFTANLESGSIPWRIQSAVNNHPWLRAFLPFVRTPVNIAKYAGSRLLSPAKAIGGAGLMGINKPFNSPYLRDAQAKLVGQLSHPDARIRSEATGRLMAGVGALMAIGTAAATGMITGGGPSDLEQKALLLQSGWQPYSIRVGDAWVSYQRLDPFASIIGTIADAQDYMKWLPPEDENSHTELANALMVAFTNNFTNKTYTTGLQNLVEALSDPAKFVPKLMERYAASMVPNAMGQMVTSVGDNYAREVEGIAAAMRAKVPFYADNMPFVRNILGEKVEKPGSFGRGTIPFADAFIPVGYREVTNNRIYQELADLKHGFTPPRAIRRGIDLRSFQSASGQTAYDRWLELSGQVVIQGNRLEGAMLKLINSREYQQMPQEPYQDILTSPRIARIQQLLSKYQSEAYRRLLGEFPDLRTQEETMAKARIDLKRGIENIIPERP